MNWSNSDVRLKAGRTNMQLLETLKFQMDFSHDSDEWISNKFHICVLVTAIVRTWVSHGRSQHLDHSTKMANSSFEVANEATSSCDHEWLMSTTLSHVHFHICQVGMSNVSNVCHGLPPLHLKRRGEKDQRTKMRRGMCSE